MIKSIFSLEEELKVTAFHCSANVFLILRTLHILYFVSVSVTLYQCFSSQRIMMRIRSTQDLISRVVGLGKEEKDIPKKWPPIDLTLDGICFLIPSSLLYRQRKPWCNIREEVPQEVTEEVPYTQSMERSPRRRISIESLEGIPWSNLFIIISWSSWVHKSWSLEDHVPWISFLDQDSFSFTREGKSSEELHRKRHAIKDENLSHLIKRKGWCRWRTRRWCLSSLLRQLHLPLFFVFILLSRLT